MTASSTTVSVHVEPITTEHDFERFFDITALAFALQARDGMWMAMNPGWDTAEGRAACISRLVDKWSSATTDQHGRSNAIYLKATVPLPNNPGKEEIAGVAIWAQASMIEGYGDKPAADLSEVMDLNALYPNNLEEQKYLRDLQRSFHGPRVELIKEIASSNSPSVMALDLCAVDPAFQRQGIATHLVNWGLNEAKRRGGLEAILEASSMGRHVYKKLGFRQEGDEIQYEVDEVFQSRDRPSNIFMRAGRC